MAKFAHIDKVAVNGRCSSHGWADQMGASTGTLAAFKVAVAGGGTAFAGFQTVGVHGQAHGAARFAPLKARGGENVVQTFRSACSLTSPSREPPWPV
jgi:hypothetical protein